MWYTATFWWKSFLKRIIFQSSVFCWCVNERTGLALPGTSIKGSRPNCDSALALASPLGPRQASRSSKGKETPWVKCPANKKLRFQQKVIRKLIREMQKRPKPKNLRKRKIRPRVVKRKRKPRQANRVEAGEVAANWKFNKLDTNDDGVSFKEIFFDLSFV